MDIDSRIHEAEVALKVQINRIEQLRNDLEHEEKKFIQMKTQLDTFRAHKTTEPHPISKLPNEALSLIFRETIEDAKQNVVLMLVCREWMRIVETDPQMWKRINVTYPNLCWNVEAWTEAHRPVILRWIARSGAALLDIKLNFTDLLQMKEQIRTRLCDGFRRTVVEVNSAKGRSSASIGDNIYQIFDDLQELTYEGLVDDEIVTEGCSGIHIIGLLGDLIGQTGEIMRRWEHFSFCFPWVDPETLSQVWMLFRYPTPHLRSLFLSNHEDLFMDWRMESPTGNQISSRFIFPDLPSLFKLDISTAMNWDVLSFRYDTVRDLAYTVIDGTTFLSRIGGFHNLTRLEISFLFQLEDFSFDVGSNTVICLPLLEELTVSHYGSYVQNLPLRLPRLIRLTLYSPEMLEDSDPPLPELTPKQVNLRGWGFYHQPVLHTQLWLTHCANHFCQSEELSFGREDKEMVVKAFKILFSGPTGRTIESSMPRCVSFYDYSELEDRKQLWTMEDLKRGRKS